MRSKALLVSKPEEKVGKYGAVIFPLASKALCIPSLVIFSKKIPPNATKPDTQQSDFLLFS
ncbi:hypothetical protein BSK20_03140 [SR1 bacterium human oral taxon HOT-345]|nr:hypothetical protein BSK20_03140 [SR1 bacterium human oral taxon HOT-345]